MILLPSKPSLKTQVPDSLVVCSAPHRLLGARGPTELALGALFRVLNDGLGLLADMFCRGLQKRRGNQGTSLARRALGGVSLLQVPNAGPRYSHHQRWDAGEIQSGSMFPKVSGFYCIGFRGSETFRESPSPCVHVNPQA